MARCDDFRLRYLETLFEIAEANYPAPGTMDRLALQGRLLYGREWERRVASDLADARRARQRSEETVTLDSVQKKRTA